MVKEFLERIIFFSYLMAYKNEDLSKWSKGETNGMLSFMLLSIYTVITNIDNLWNDELNFPNPLLLFAIYCTIYLFLYINLDKNKKIDKIYEKYKNKRFSLSTKFLYYAIIFCCIFLMLLFPLIKTINSL